MDVTTFPENQQTTSDLSILLHEVISLPEVTSYDKRNLLPVESHNGLNVEKHNE